MTYGRRAAREPEAAPCARAGAVRARVGGALRAQPGAVCARLARRCLPPLVLLSLLLVTACSSPGSGSDGDRKPRVSGDPTPTYPTAGHPATLAPVANSPARPAPGRAVPRPRPGDFNGDGYDDVALVTAGRLAVVHGSPEGPDPEVRTTVPLPADPGAGAGDAREPALLDRGDLDRDGFTDLVVTLRTGPQYALWGSARGLLGPARRLDTGVRTVTDPGGAWRAGAAADLDGDGSTDLVRLGTAHGPAARISYGPFDRSAGTPSRNQDLPGERAARGEPYVVEAGDTDGDGRHELTLRFRGGDGRPGEAGDGGPRVVAVHHFRGTAEGPVLAARTPGGTGFEGVFADADGDGEDELVVAQLDGQARSLSITVNRRPGTAAPPARTLTDLPGPGAERPGDSAGHAVGDVTGDGRPDLVLGAPYANGQRGAVFLAPAIYRAGKGSSVLRYDLESPGDSDSDGQPGGGAREFTRLTPLTPLLDVNGDGRLDVVVASADPQHPTGFRVLPGSATGLNTRDSVHIPPEDIQLGPGTG